MATTATSKDGKDLQYAGVAQGAHTPGPWRVDPKAAFRVVAGVDDTVANTGCQSDLRDCWEHNATLIAAAPDMLEALRAHAEWHRKDSEGPQYPAGVTRDDGGEAIWLGWWNDQLALWVRAVELTAAAIAKAEGH